MKTKMSLSPVLVLLAAGGVATNTCGDIKQTYNASGCCGTAPTTPLFDSVAFTALHGENFTPTDYYFNVTLPLANLKQSANGIFAGGLVEYGGVYHDNGTKVLTPKMAMDPLVFGNDGRPYIMISAYWTFDLEAECDLCEPKQVFLLYNGVARFYNDDPNKWFVDAVGVGSFISQLEANLDPILSTQLIMTSYDEGLTPDASHATFKYRIHAVSDTDERIPPGLPTALGRYIVL